ncbi:MAG TPA: HTTM domain-containing protein, partial [Polyangiales bacterium]
VHYRAKLGDGRELRVSPRRYLTQHQEREMSGQPDLILQLAHHIARELDAHGLGPVQVRADALVALNGRPAQRMIDPDVDLARVQDGLGKADWITPGPP